MTRLKLLLLFILLAPLAHAEARGIWVMRLGGKTFLTITVDDGKAEVSSPRHYSQHRGGFARISSETITRKMEVKELAQALELAEPGGSFPLFRLDPQVRALYFLDGEGKILSTAVVESLDQAPPPLNTEWPRSGRLYSQEPAFPDNEELAQLFAEDQSDRQTQPIDWKSVTPRDQARRLRLRELLQEGKVQSGLDLENAAFIFQHSDQSSDYLLAHTLALLAVVRGERNATWIASAALDRYLKSIGQPQIYGTQFHKTGSEGWTQQPMDEKLVSDALRRMLGVPERSEQKKQLEKLRATAP